MDVKPTAHGQAVGERSSACLHGQLFVNTDLMGLALQSSSKGLPACCGAGNAFMEHSSTQVGCRPGLEHLSGPCHEPGPVAAVPGGRAWPYHPLWLALGLLVLRLCSAENFLKKPSGRQVLEKPSVTGPAPAAHLRLSFANISRCLFVLQSVVIKRSQNPRSGLRPVITTVGCSLCLVTLVATIPAS